MIDIRTRTLLINETNTIFLNSESRFSTTHTKHQSNYKIANFYAFMKISKVHKCTRNAYNTQKYIKYRRVSTYSNAYLVDETHLF